MKEPTDSNEPGRLAVLTEFHQQVEKLPDDQRMVFEMRYYAGFSQVEIAQILGLPPKQVSRLWLAATRRLALWLKEFASRVDWLRLCGDDAMECLMPTKTWNRQNVPVEATGRASCRHSFQRRRHAEQGDSGSPGEMGGTIPEKRRRVPGIARHR